MRFVRGVLRILGWLLTPLVAWAASFGGAWLSAVISGGSQRSLSTIKTMVVFGALSGFAGAWAWLRLLRRSPKLQEALAVAPDGTPLVALGHEAPTDAK